MPTTADAPSPEPVHEVTNPRAPHHARRLRTHHVARTIGLVATGALAFAASAAGSVYLDLKSQITVSDATDYVVGGPTVDPVEAPSKPADPDDPFAGKALNILVMGTDYRDAENAAIAGHEDGMRSDTTFIVHVSGDRTRMEVVSIPRDSLVSIPSCKLPGGGMSAPQYGMFNSAFEIGSGGVDDIDHAAACTITTVQELTGVPITNHVVVKMTGVIGVVDAVGGVTMCFPEPVVENPYYGDLNIPAGPHELDGRESIDFLRARHGTGLGLEKGSDLTRITRQQAFIDSMSREVLSKNVITNSPQLYRMIKAALSSVTADKSLADPTALAGLAYSLRNIDPSEVVFTELPVVDAPNDKNRVVWAAGNDVIWQRFVDDEAPPGHEKDPRDDATGDAVPADKDAGDAPEAGSPDDGTSGSDDSSGSEGTDAGDGTDQPAADDDLLPGVCPPD